MEMLCLFGRVLTAEQIAGKASRVVQVVRRLDQVLQPFSETQRIARPVNAQIVELVLPKPVLQPPVLLGQLDWPAVRSASAEPAEKLVQFAQTRAGRRQRVNWRVAPGPSRLALPG